MGGSEQEEREVKTIDTDNHNNKKHTYLQDTIFTYLIFWTNYLHMKSESILKKRKRKKKVF